MAISRAGSSTGGTSPEVRTGTQTQDDYRPIRRINRACHACRRKKSRCTGGHPCRSCRRLGELCEYPAAIARAPRPPEDDGLHEAVGPAVIGPAPTSDRLDALESRLDTISQQLGQLTEITRQLLNASAPSEQNATQASPPPTYAPGLGNPSPLNDPFHPVNWAVKLDHLVPPPVLRSVFRDYFRHAHNQPYSFFHEPSFWTRLDAGLLPDHLLLAVLSHALRFSSDSFFGDRAMATSNLFANMAWKAIVYLYFQERADADLAAVQTITILSMYDFTAGHDRHDSAWVKIGVAVRMAQDLCLMTEDAAASLTPTDAEERRRVFWSVYMLDRLASCARARPPAVLEASCHLSLPCEERLWRAGLPSPGYRLDDVIASGGLAGDQNPGFPALVVAMTSIVGRCTQCMLQGPGGRPRQAPWDQTSDYATICSEILTCEGYFEQPVGDALAQYCTDDAGNIDPTVAGPLMFAHALNILSHCLLSQPLLFRERVMSSHSKPAHTFLSRALKSSRENAARMAYLIRDATAAGYTPRSSFYGYCIVIAASIHAVGTSSQDEAVRDQSASCLALCREMLTELARYWPSCLSMSHVIDNLVKRAHVYTLLTSPATLLDPMEALDRDRLFSVLDYNTVCKEPDGLWNSTTRPASPAPMQLSATDLAALGPDNFEGLFSAFAMQGTG